MGSRGETKQHTPSSPKPSSQRKQPLPSSSPSQEYSNKKTQTPRKQQSNRQTKKEIERGCVRVIKHAKRKAKETTNDATHLLHRLGNRRHCRHQNNPSDIRVLHISTQETSINHSVIWIKWRRKEEVRVDDGNKRKKTKRSNENLQTYLTGKNGRQTCTSRPSSHQSTLKDNSQMGRRGNGPLGAGEMAGKGWFLPLPASQKDAGAKNEKQVVPVLVPHRCFFFDPRRLWY